MPLPGITPKVQSDLVPSEEKVYTENVRLPGIEKLHEKPVDEIAAVLANFVKSRPSMVSMKFVIGSHIEVVTKE